MVLHFIGSARRPKNLYRLSTDVSWKMWFGHRKSQVRNNRVQNHDLFYVYNN